jgi:hypothetical protein
MQDITRAKTLHQGQFSRLIKITQGTSRYPERDVLVLMLGHHCGMRITARMTCLLTRYCVPRFVDSTWV